MGTRNVDSADFDFTRFLSLLADELTRSILSHLSEEPMTVRELVEQCDVSDRTVYRRLNDLQDHDLVEEATRMDADGHLYSKYHTHIERIDIDITPREDAIDVDVTYRDDVDGFIDLWGGLGALGKGFDEK